MSELKERYATYAIRMLLSSLILFGCLNVFADVPAESDIPSVLLLHSYHNGLSWTDGITEAVEDAFGVQKTADLYIEYMDTKRYPLDQTEADLVTFYSARYKNKRFDAIIVCDNNALSFIKRHRLELAPATPIIFCGINHYNDELIDDSGWFTGVVEKTAPGKTFDLMHRLHPQLERCIVIGDDTSTGRAEIAEAKTQLGEMRDSVAVEYWVNPTTSDLLERLVELDPVKDAVLLTVFNRDAADSYYSYEESGAFISRAAPCPVYGLWDFYLGTGIVGGHMASANDQGQKAAELAKLTLGGIPPTDISIIRESPNRNLFDLHRLDGLGIRLSDLPENSQVINNGNLVYTAAAEQEIKLGVLAKRGKEICSARWGATADYLTRVIPGHRVELVPLNFDEIRAAVREQEIDFLITNPSQYVEMDAEYGLGLVATLVNKRLNKPYTEFGGVIVCREDRQDIRSLNDLRDKRFAAVDAASFGGWQMAWREMKRQGIDPFKDFTEVSFTGTHDAVVAAVIAGDVDAGTIRTDTLERMQAEQAIDVSQFRVLHPQATTPDFPFVRSTALYPEWPLARLSHTSREIAQRVASAMVGMPSECEAAIAAQCNGWTIPPSYQTVHECLIELRIGPYQDYGDVSLADTLKRYWPGITAALLLILASWIFAVHVLGLNRRMREMADDLTAINDRYDQLAEQNHTVTWEVDAEGLYTYVSHISESLHNYQPEELIGKKHFYEMRPAGDRDRIKKRMFEYFARKEAFQNLESRLEAKNGTLFWISTNGIPILDETGELIGYRGNSTDITNRKQTEEALLEVNRRMRLAADSAAFGVWDLNLKTNEMEWDDWMIRIYGIDPSDFSVALETWRNVIHPDDVEQTFKEVELARHGQKEFDTEFRIIHPSGDVRNIRAHGIVAKDADGIPIHLTGINYDITKQRRAEADLQNAHERTLAIMQSVQAGIIMVRAKDKVIVEANAAAAEMVGLTQDGLIGNLCTDQICPAECDACPVLDLGCVVNNSEVSITRIDGVGVPVLKTVSRILIDGEEHLLENFVDITDLRAVQEDLEQTNEALERMIDHAHEMTMEAKAANKAKSRFLANMSHEIRTPMNGVIGMTSLLMSMELSSEHRHIAEIIQSSGNALLALINDILDLSKIEADRMELDAHDFDLQSLLDEFAEMIAVRAQEKGLEFIYATDSSVPVLLHGDPGRLRQILINLTGNAVKFTSAGEVDVRINVVSEGDEEVLLHFSIRDTGIGISEDKRERLFDAFQQADSSTTREYGGTGLGLTISRRLVELMDGKIGFDTEIGRGSLFWFTAKFSKQMADNTAYDPVFSSLQPVHTLIVDDNATCRDVVGRMLENLGARTDTAATGDEAIRLIQLNTEKNDPYQVVIVDMQMPGMNGEELGRLIRAVPTLQDIQLVLMTDIGHQFDLKRLNEAGYTASLTKPIRQSALDQCLDLLINGPAESPTQPEPSLSLVTLDAREIARRNGYRILLAEDNPVNQLVALKTLVKHNYRADIVSNGAAAVEAVKSGRYDLVLMDVQMPLMDGFKATIAIRMLETESDLAHLPIIAMTAHAIRGDRERCLASGMDDYISKPIKLETLLEVLEKWLPESPEKDRLPSPETIWDWRPLLDNFAGDQVVLASLVETALEDLPRRIDDLKSCLQSREMTEAVRHAHSIKGAAANLGAEPLRRVAAQIEQTAYEEVEPVSLETITALESEFERLRIVMTEFAGGDADGELAA